MPAIKEESRCQLASATRNKTRDEGTYRSIGQRIGCEVRATKGQLEVSSGLLPLLPRCIAPLTAVL